MKKETSMDEHQLAARQFERLKDLGTLRSPEEQQEQGDAQMQERISRIARGLKP